MPPGHFTTPPSKNDLVINPKTQRPIKVGGTVWRKLVREGIFEGIYSDTKELGDLPENEDEIEDELNQIQQTLPIGKQAVRGRGRFAGKIVSRSKPLDSEEVSRYTAKIASKMAKENMTKLADSEDVEAELEKLILHEMAIKKVINKKPPITSKPIDIPKRGRPKKEEYRLRQKQTTTEEDDETSDVAEEEYYEEE